MTYLELFNTKTVKETLDLLSEDWVENRQLEFFNARTVGEAISRLDQHSSKAKIIAGGVDLLRLMRRQIIDPKVLVNIETIPQLTHITEDAEGLSIGALSRISDLETSPIIRDKYSLLAEAAYSVSSPQIRNMATIGGNLRQDVNCWYYRMSPVTGRTFFCYRKGGSSCFAVNGDNRYHAIIDVDTCHAVCQSDLAPALIALGATANIASPDGERIIPVEALYQPLGNILKPNELITEIKVPAPRPKTSQKYLKFRLRKTIDPAISSVAAAITIKAGRIEQASIVLGGVAPIPYRSIKAQDILKGQVLTEYIAGIAADAAVSSATPLSMNAHKLSISRALVKRAILGRNS